MNENPVNCLLRICPQCQLPIEHLGISRCPRCLTELEWINPCQACPLLQGCQKESPKKKKPIQE